MSVGCQKATSWAMVHSHWFLTRKFIMIRNITSRKMKKPFRITWTVSSSQGKLHQSSSVLLYNVPCPNKMFPLLVRALTIFYVPLVLRHDKIVPDKKKNWLLVFFFCCCCCFCFSLTPIRLPELNPVNVCRTKSPRLALLYRQLV